MATQTLRNRSLLKNLPHFRGVGREGAFSDRRVRRTAAARISPAQGFKALQALWYGIESPTVEGFADCAAQSHSWSRETPDSSSTGVKSLSAFFQGGGFRMVSMHRRENTTNLPPRPTVCRQCCWLRVTRVKTGVQNAAIFLDSGFRRNDASWFSQQHCRLPLRGLPRCL
ncbi:hypothetical protein DSTSK_09180 [Desulforhabdus sp. TSK]|nr:hypothetical protein DSTSK_09180 [Desulforhabdus sp. TSK]